MDNLGDYRRLDHYRANWWIFHDTDDQKSRIAEDRGQSIGENIAEKAIEEATGQKADVSADEKSVSIKIGDGTMTASEEGNIKLPADFPTDVFVPSDAKITYAFSIPANATTDTKANFMVTFGTGQGVSDVVAKYKAEMAKNGWTMESEANFGAMIINFTKGTRTVAVTITATKGEDVKNGATRVSITGSEN